MPKEKDITLDNFEEELEETSEKIDEDLNSNTSLQKEKSYYFYEREEKAFVDYIHSKDPKERERIFRDLLQPAFKKMVESIIRKYNLFTPGEDFSDTYNDCMSFLVTKIENFDPDSGFKAYSYCGTIIKNYLIFKLSNGSRSLKKNASFELMANDLNEDVKFSYTQLENSDDLNTELIESVTKTLEELIRPENKNSMTENEYKVGASLLSFFKNWQELMDFMGSTKFNRVSVNYYLKETTLLSPTEIKEAMRKFRKLYYALKLEMI